MSILVLALNVLTPFSLGTFFYMCFFHQKNSKDTCSALKHIFFTIFIYFLLIIFSKIAVVNGSRNDMQWFLMLFFLLLLISYAWGIIFGSNLVIRVRRNFIAAQLSSPIIGNTATQVYNSNAPYYQPQSLLYHQLPLEY